MLKAKQYQIGGTHYRRAIQSWDIIDINQFDYYRGTALAYLLRKKPGVSRTEDLQKATHCIEKLLEGPDPTVNRHHASCALSIADIYCLSHYERDLVAMLLSRDDKALYGFATVAQAQQDALEQLK